MEPNKKNKNWNILVPYYSDELSDIALQEAIALCKVFDSGLVIFNDNSDEQKKSQLAAIVKNTETLHNLKVSLYVTEKKNNDFLFYLAKKTESILIVIGHNKKETSLGKNISATLRYMRLSRTPFIMVPQGIHQRSFKEIAYVIGHQKQEKEKILWASYFGRIYKSKIKVYTATPSDQNYKTGINGNISVLKKLYASAEVEYEIIKENVDIFSINKTAISNSKSGVGAFITLTTLRPDIFDIFGGSDEKKLICNPFNVSVLCINPRDDLYVLCN